MGWQARQVKLRTCKKCKKEKLQTAKEVAACCEVTK